MSVKAMNWVWEHSEAAGNNRLTLLAIADRCNDEGEDAWPSIASLMAKTRLSESTVRRCIQSLAKSKELDVELKAGPNGTNKYRIRYEARLPIFEVAQKARTKRTVQSDTRQSDTSRGQNDTGQTDTPGFNAVTPGGCHGRDTRGVSGVTPNTSCTPSTPSTYTFGGPQSGAAPDRRTNDGTRLRAFIAWWCERYRELRRCSYHVQAKKDIPNVRRLLETYGDEQLRAMALVLLTDTADPFIARSERGIGILSVKASWLAGKCAEAAERAKPRLVPGCSHEPRCMSSLACQNRIAHPERYEEAAG